MASEWRQMVQQETSEPIPSSELIPSELLINGAIGNLFSFPILNLTMNGFLIVEISFDDKVKTSHHPTANPK